ncbi:metallophosphoesterase [Paracoccus actinidiae]|uniref:metallophosphoesterase n=1 Tax=Paracoccus actinidiae TaxID=3064531 RepID=UPI0027D219B3|nr:metallophosphoesterase [Paracoccus sp. M09]
MFTIIPDIHADWRRLEASLSMAAGTKPAFLGDFIDAGKGDMEQADDRRVLQRVRGLIDGDQAIAIMGNHELNAILFHRRGADGQPLRAQTKKNAGQHASFIEAIGVETPEALAWTDWFLEALPLWYDRQGLKLVHACWFEPEIELIRVRRPDGRLRPEDLPEIAREDTDFGRAVKLITSGREVALPRGVSFLDKRGDRRQDVRLAWWRQDKTWRDAALSVPDRSSLPDSPLPGDIVTPAHPAGAAPVFVGHYKMDGQPRVESKHVLCLDYPATPCVYRWSGETQIDPTRLQEIPAHKLALAGNKLISTGWGTFVLEIRLRTPRGFEDDVHAALGLKPSYRESDPDGVYYTWSPTHVKRRDDETIVYTLANYLPAHIPRAIVWEESRY